MKSLMVRLPVCAMFLTVFGMEAARKFSGGHVPDWFIKQFEHTPLNIFPGSLAVSFYMIALLETATAVAFAVSFFRPRLMRVSLFLATIVFLVLAFGARLSADFNSAFQLFGYFTLTFLVLRSFERPEERLSGAS